MVANTDGHLIRRIQGHWENENNLKERYVLVGDFTSVVILKYFRV